MGSELKQFKNNNLKERVKKLIKKSQEMKIIKPHIKAFEENPTNLEQHKGNLNAYRK